MTQEEFNQKVESFGAVESMRGALYYRALDLIAAGFVVDAHILILATWNFAGFRYAMQLFDLSAYEITLRRLEGELSRFGDDELMSVDLTEHRDAIVAAFDELAKFPGIKYTGAAKMLHLLKPHIFVMWDTAIMGQSSPRRDYASLDIVISKFWENRRFEQSGVGYHEFLVFCQDRFRGFTSPDGRKTLAKCIDEFNYSQITVPLAARRKQKMGA